MKRRAYLKNACTLCMGATMFGLFQSLQSCTAIELFRAEAVNSKIDVPLSLFVQKQINIVRVKGQPFDIAVVKNAGDTYKAFQLKCTHASNELLFTGNFFICNLHGSKFSIEGKVTKGPAEENLLSFQTELLNDRLVILL